MKKIDKTKENIGVKFLNEKEKKDLFEKFVDAGGQVIEEKKSHGFTDFDREKQKKFRHKIDDHRKNISKKENTAFQRESAPVNKPKKIIKKDKPDEIKISGFQLFIEKFYIRLKLYLMGVADFSAYALKPKFLKKFNFEYKTALIELQMVYMDIYKQNPQISKRVLEDLDKFKLIYFELIEKISGIYERSLFDPMVDNINNFPDLPFKLSEAKELLLTLFKKLYVLYLYQEPLVFAFEKSISLQMKYEKKGSSVYSNKRKKVKNSVYIIFNKLFPALYWLFCNYFERIIKVPDPIVDKLLTITDDDKPGSRKKSTGPMQAYALPEFEEADKDEDSENAKGPKIPDDVKKGLELMYNLNLQNLRDEFFKNSILLKQKSDTDKVLIAFLLLHEFDKEYSFILTTNKIKYKSGYSKTGTVDYKIKFSDLYNEYRKCQDSLKDYSDDIMIFDKARQEKPVSNEQYMDYSTKLNALEKKKKAAGSGARFTIKKFMETISGELALLAQDMDGEQNIVDNPQDEIEFEFEIEGNKKLNKKKVYEAILQAYYYSSALAYRLGLQGDLSGNIEMKNGEESIDKSSQPMNQGAAKKEIPGEEPAGEAPSVIDELDDMF